jgi:hypothetical protein
MANRRCSRGRCNSRVTHSRVMHSRVMHNSRGRGCSRCDSKGCEERGGRRGRGGRGGRDRDSGGGSCRSDGKGAEK